MNININFVKPEMNRFASIVFSILLFFVCLLFLTRIRCSRQINFVYGYPLEMLYTNAVVKIDIDSAHPFSIALGYNKEVHLVPKSKDDYMYIPGDLMNVTDFDFLWDVEALDFFDVYRKLIIPRRQWEHFIIGLDCKMGNKQDASVKIFNGRTKELLCEIFVDY